jgi:pectate lyase
VAEKKHFSSFLVCVLAGSGLVSAPALEPRAEPPQTVSQERAFPGAEGWAATTPGGRGGRILRVTTLAPVGPGSLVEALKAKGPRIVVFEVGGVIDLHALTDMKHQFVTITEPFLTIAGQTAPSPGITLIRGGLLIFAHDVVIQHIRVRPGEAGYAKASGWEPDGISTTQHARDVIVDHCSFSWAIDENLSASSKPFEGATPEEWRANASHRITFSYNIIAEGLNKATHSKVAHSKGSLIMDNCSDILILGNLFADNVERNPQIKGGTWSAVVNNYIYNPGVTAIHYHLNDRLWQGRAPLIGKTELVGNVMRYGADTMKGLALLRFVGSGDLELHAEDNLVFDQAGNPGPIIREDNRYGGKIRSKSEQFYWPPGLRARPVAEVQEYVLHNAGARPWDRDSIDQRIVRQSGDETGKVIDSEQQVGGYPVMKETRQAFQPADWDLRTMTRKGINR